MRPRQKLRKDTNKKFPAFRWVFNSSFIELPTKFRLSSDTTLNRNASNFPLCWNIPQKLYFHGTLTGGVGWRTRFSMYVFTVKGRSMTQRDGLSLKES